MQFKKLIDPAIEELTKVDSEITRTEEQIINWLLDKQIITESEIPTRIKEAIDKKVSLRGKLGGGK